MEAAKCARACETEPVHEAKATESSAEASAKGNATDDSEILLDLGPFKVRLTPVVTPEEREQKEKGAEEDDDLVIESLVSTEHDTAPEPAEKAAEQKNDATEPEESTETSKSIEPTIESPAASPGSVSPKSATLLFSHEFPKGAYGDYVRKHATADSINVEASPLNGGSVKISGLWHPSAPSSFRRATSPRSARVRDVDENGEEVMLPEDSEPDSDTDNSVEFDYSAVQDLPASQFTGVRAELGDDGFKLWIDE